jgi:hypothetical protein
MSVKVFSRKVEEVLRPRSIAPNAPPINLQVKYIFLKPIFVDRARLQNNTRQSIKVPSSGCLYQYEKWTNHRSKYPTMN